MTLKERVKRGFGPLWPWIALPVRTLRVLLAALRDLPRMLRWDRVKATARFVGEYRRSMRSPALPGRAVAGEPAPLRVAVDVSPYWEPLTGVGWYLHQLLCHLSGEPSLRIELFGPTAFLDAGDPPPAVALPTGPSIATVALVVPPDVLFPGVVVRVLRRLEPRILARRRQDVVFAPNFLLPPKLRRLRGALVVTVHDLGVRHVAWSLDDRTREALERDLAAGIAGAAAVVTPSAAVAAEVVAAGLKPASAVTAIHHGPGQVASAVEEPLPGGLGPGYALFVGTLEPRKNLELLLDLWPPLRAERSDWPELVVCGAWGWKTEAMRDRVAAAEREGWLRRLGYVDDGTLLGLYRGARLLVFPSLYEGFGLPLLEALAVGCPVLCSDLPVFREVAGDAADFAATGDREGWLAALRRLVGDPARRTELARRGRLRATAFDWDRAAAETLAVWRRAALREPAAAAPAASGDRRSVA